MTVLLIPGLICDRFVWEPVLARLDAEVADLTTQDNLTVMAQDCLDRYPGTLRVAGHSMGARVAMEMARIAPDRIERLALLDTGIHPLADGEIEKRRAIVDFANTNGMQALADRWLPGMVTPENQKNADLMRGLTDMVLRMTPEIHARQINALVHRPDAGIYLPQITCPTLLMVGEDDQWSPVAQHQTMLDLMPNARLEVIAQAGHFAPVERPDAVADILVPFLKG